MNNSRAVFMLVVMYTSYMIMMSKATQVQFSDFQISTIFPEQWRMIVLKQ